MRLAFSRSLRIVFATLICYTLPPFASKKKEFFGFSLMPFALLSPSP